MAARLSKRADNRYAKTATVNGRRIFAYGKTQAEAKRDLAERVARAEAGAPVRDATRTLGDWLHEWEEGFLKVSPRAESTRQNYATLLRVHVVPVIGDVRLDKLMPTHVVRVLTTMQDAGLAGSTRRTARTALAAALKDAQASGLIRDNAAERSPRPANPHQEARSLTKEEAGALFQGAQGLRYADALTLALLTGLRRGEVLALRWDDIDLDRAELRVKGSLVRQGGVLVISSTKTAAGRRTLALGPVVVALLAAHGEVQRAEKDAAGDMWQGTGFVFCTEFGLPVDPRNLLRAVKKATQRAGLPERDANGKRIGVHTLRHSSATGRYMSGVPDLVVSQDLGHSDTAFTKRMYGHVTTAAQRTSAEAVESYFAV